MTPNPCPAPDPRRRNAVPPSPPTPIGIGWRATFSRDSAAVARRRRRICLN